ncbi:MAG: hypothetical protein IPG75_07545 [Gemmatimonadetes bacterium]|nr:hypothetical protein [Gemmatimonadota bacterium]
MSWLARLQNLVRSARHGRDLDRELDFHLAELADTLEGARPAAGRGGAGRPAAVRASCRGA